MIASLYANVTPRAETSGNSAFSKYNAPPTCALLFWKVRLKTFKYFFSSSNPLLKKRPPPSRLALLSEKIELIRLTFYLTKVIPAPTLALFPLKTELLTTTPFGSIYWSNLNSD